MGHHELGLIFSSLVMLLIFALVIIVEHRCGERSSAFFKRTEPQIDDLARRAQEKYRARYGKDPTMKIHVLGNVAQKE